MIPEELGSHLHYDERIAIENYVLRNYAHLLSEDERAAMESGLARWWDENLEQMHEWGAKTRTKLRDAPPYEPAPFDESHARQVTAIVDRLRVDHPDEIRIRRCAVCGRVARKPTDERCPWCLSEGRWRE
jgi:rubrerythrin